MYRQTAKVGSLGSGYVPPENGGGGVIIIPSGYPYNPDQTAGGIGTSGGGSLPVILFPNGGSFPIIYSTPQGTNNNTTMVSNPTSAQCSCFTGQAYIDSQGNCACHSSSETNTTVTPTKYVDVNPQGQIIYVQAPNTTPQSTFNLSQTLKDNPMLAIGGLLFIGFLVFKK